MLGAGDLGPQKVPDQVSRPSARDHLPHPYSPATARVSLHSLPLLPKNDGLSLGEPLTFAAVVAELCANVTEELDEK